MIDAPYRHESDTSRQAAEGVSRHLKSDNEIVLDFIKSRGQQGATIDEVAVYLTAISDNDREVPIGTASARINGLLKEKSITKTPMKRKTRSGYTAVVHIVGTWVDNIVHESPDLDASERQHRIAEAELAMKKFKSGQSVFGHGHVVDRNDGRKEGCGGPRNKICRTCSQAEQYMALLQEKLDEAYQQ